MPPPPAPSTLVSGQTRPEFVAALCAFLARLALPPDEWAYVHFPISANAGGNGTERSCWYGNDYLLLARVRRTLAAVTNRSAYQATAARKLCVLSGFSNFDFQLRFWTLTALSHRRSICSCTFLTISICVCGQWWTGGNAWAADESRAARHFEYEHMIGSPHTFYNAALGRYILPNYGSINSRTRLPWSETAGVGAIAKSAFPAKFASCSGASCPYHSTQLALYEAERPWGPWKRFYFQSQWEWGGDGPQGAGHSGAVGDPYSSGAYSPDFPAEWISEDGKSMMMVSTACCNFTSFNSTGLVPKEAGYQAHWTPVRITLMVADPPTSI